MSEAVFARLMARWNALEAELVAQKETTFLLRVRECLTALPASVVPYQHIVVDEAQDLHPLHWRLLRRLVPAQPNDVFLVSDADQRLYRTPFPLSHCGVDTRNRSKRLTKNYRCSMTIPARDRRRVPARRDVRLMAGA